MKDLDKELEDMLKEAEALLGDLTLQSPDPGEPVLLRVFARIAERMSPKDVRKLCTEVDKEMDALEERLKAALAALDYRSVKYAAEELWHLSRFRRVMCAGK